MIAITMPSKLLLLLCAVVLSLSLIAQLSPHRKSICFHKPHKNIATKIIAALTYDKPYDSFRHLRGDEIRLQVFFFVRFSLDSPCLIIRNEQV